MKYPLYLLIAIFAFGTFELAANTSRKERRYVREGNELYKKGKYKEAAKDYQLALSLNPSFAAAKYNLSLSQLRIAVSPDTPEKQKQQYMQEGAAGMNDISGLGASDPKLASKANYNLGNIAFNSQKYPEAISFYKQALRFNPDDDVARRNLRIAQKKLDQQNQDNKQNQDKNKNKQDQKKDQNKNNDKKQDQQNQNNQQQQQNSLSNQTMDQILKAAENRENAARARLNAAGKGNKSQGAGRNRKNW